MAEKTTCGLDIGGTNIKGVLLQGDNVLKDIKVKSNAKQSPEALRQAIRSAVAGLGGEFAAMGVGCAGSVDSRAGEVRNSPNFDWNIVYPLGEWVTEDFNVPVTVENDANCAVVTEWRLGAGRGCDNLVLLTLGTGVGGGLVLNGQLFRGSTGTGAEIGHMVLHGGGLPCPCGHRGCFERYVSATALRGKVPGREPKEVFAMAKHEPPLRQVVEEFLMELKWALTSLTNVFNPDKILIGGGVAEGVAPYRSDLQDWVREHAFPTAAAHVSIQLTEHHNLSGAVGAALLAEDLLGARRLAPPAR